MMKSKILNFFSELRASYWYIPLLLAITALLLSILTLELDHVFVWHWLDTVGWFHASNPEGARALLSTIANSMITVAGVTFSMTIVAVAFAASQVGPRLTSNFMRDRGNQITLGIFIATFLYCLFILFALFNANKSGIIQIEGVFIPQISLLVALMLAISSTIVLIYFFHHIPESINMSNVIARIGEEINCQLESLFPCNVGTEYHDKTFELPSAYSKQKTITSTKQGYIRIIDGSSLVRIAKKHDLIIKLEAKYGGFITTDSILLTVYSKDVINDLVHNQCNEAFVLGYKRNQEADTLFLVDELVEIIARALSPGVNDPFTAMTCLDWLQSSMQQLSKKNQPSAYRYDSNKDLRLIAPPITFTEFCDLIFSKIQCYVAKDRNVAVHMMNMIIFVHNTVTHDEHKVALAKYANSLKQAIKESLFHDDVQTILNLHQHYITENRIAIKSGLFD